MSRAGRFLRQVAHTRPTQLLHRALSRARTLLHDAAPAFSVSVRKPRIERTNPHPPRRVFAPRVGLVDARESGPQAHIAGASVALDGQIDWRGARRSALECFHLHYMEYLEALDDTRFERLVLDWIERNPRACVGSWRVGWHSYVIAVRTVVWMQQLAERGAALRAATRRRIEASLVEQLSHLASHLERDIVGNHLIKDAKALLWASRYFQGPSARAWGELAQRVLLAELEEQVLPDGMHYERSPSYHAQVFADFVECASIGRGELRARLLAKLEPMAQVLVDLAHPDGLACLFNDAGLHTSYSPDECQRAWESVSGGRVRRRAQFALPNAGYYGLREGNSLLVADCGAISPAHLPAHGHGDVLSFEWSLGGQRIFVDAGVAQYDSGPERAHSRATASHNTLTVDGADQAEFWSSFRVGRRPRVRVLRHESHPGGFLLEGEHDGYRHLAGSPIHRRRIVCTSRTLLIDDEVRGGGGQRVQTRLLLHPSVAAIVTKEHRVRLTCGGVELMVESRSPVRLEDAWWCPDIGVRLKTSRLVFEMPPAPCRETVRIQRVDSALAAFAHSSTRADAA